MHGYYPIRKVRILGASLHVHWTVVVIAVGLILFSKSQPGPAALAIACYLGIILLHESGHAFVAKRLGHPPLRIGLSAIHGHCEYSAPDTLKEDAMIAWGGILAQFAVALPLIALNMATSVGKLPVVGTVIAFFGYYSLIVAMFNLIPVRGLDGRLAWRLIPIVFREARQRSMAKKATKALLRRVK